MGYRFGVDQDFTITPKLKRFLEEYPEFPLTNGFRGEDKCDLNGCKEVPGMLTTLTQLQTLLGDEPVEEAITCYGEEEDDITHFSYVGDEWIIEGRELADPFPDLATYFEISYAAITNRFTRGDNIMSIFNPKTFPENIRRNSNEEYLIHAGLRSDYGYVGSKLLNLELLTKEQRLKLALKNGLTVTGKICRELTEDLRKIQTTGALRKVTPEEYSQMMLSFKNAGAELGDPFTYEGPIKQEKAETI